MTLATTVSIPAVRGPILTAKTLGAINLLPGGRLVVGVGPGSSERDYLAVGVPFQERWKRFNEVIEVLRPLWTANSEGFTGNFYSTEGIHLEPYPPHQPGPPIWVASWGIKGGLRRTARSGDGWIASEYNTTRARFAQSLRYLSEQLSLAGKAPESFPNGIATMWMYVTEDRSRAEQNFSTVPSSEPSDRRVAGATAHRVTRDVCGKISLLLRCRGPEGFPLAHGRGA